MGWSVGDDHGRDIGYGVPGVCDHPDCDEQIDRGLGYVCGGQPWGGEDGCGRFFCTDHGGGTLCERCESDQPPFEPSPDTLEWMRHKLTHPSWAPWLRANPEKAAAIREAVARA